MFELKPTPSFRRKLHKLIQKNQKLSTTVSICLEKLRQDPFTSSLRSHKIIDRTGNVAFSSRVNGDIRILWKYHKNEIQVLRLLDIGGHSGNKKVYK